MPMRTQLNSETEGEKRLEAGGGLPSAEALFADALIASYRRAIESVAAARTDIRAAAHRLAAPAAIAELMVSRTTRMAASKSI